MNRFVSAFAIAAAGCTSFEDPDIVVDLRVLAIRAEHPEQIVDLDLANPQAPTELLSQLVPTTVCALVADPAVERRLRYEATLCFAYASGRCTGIVKTPIGSGFTPDPDTNASGLTQMCAPVMPNGNLLSILVTTAEDDFLAALGGIDYRVEFVVGGEGTDPTTDEHAAKLLRVSPRIPPGRVPNENPRLDRIEVRRAGGDPAPLGLGRCAEQASPLEVAPGTRLRLEPIESAGTRQEYTVPTLNGRTQTFTESLTYQWIASAGSFTSGSTGGIRDIAGNYPPLFTEWRAPSAADLAGPTSVALWIVQRDERLGVTWYESCVRVVP